MRTGQTRAGERWLFRDLDLDVAAGECLVLTGDNGSGKSTLLTFLYGTRTLTAGTIEVAGRTPAERDVQFRQAVAVLLDDSELLDELPAPGSWAGRSSWPRTTRRCWTSPTRWYVSGEALALR